MLTLDQTVRVERRAMKGLTALAAVVALGIAGGEVRAEGAAGSVAGTVRLVGEPPPNAVIALGADHHCVKIAGHRPVQEEVVVGQGGGLANVLVRLEGDGLAAAAGAVPADPVVIEQSGCIYRPRVAAGRAGQTLRVVNLDPAFHNVRSVSSAGSDFNIAQPFVGMKYDFKLAAEQKMLRLHCDAHPWMRAFVAVEDHPWFAVTGDDGRFELAGVPPGRYDVVLSHERFGTLRKTVSVAAVGAVAVDFDYQADAGSRP